MNPWAPRGVGWCEELRGEGAGAGERPRREEDMRGQRIHGAAAVRTGCRSESADAQSAQGLWFGWWCAKS